MNDERPTCYVIAGPNGAGKTTFALRYLKELTGCRNFINADLIADGLSPLDPSNAQMEAGKILLREIRSKVDEREDFAFETTLSGRSYVRLLEELLEKGWRTVLFYLWIPSARFSAARVQQRVESGGHDIPAEAIARRYSRTILNLLNVFAPLVNEVICYNNSRTEPFPIFVENNGERIIVDEELYRAVLRSCYD